MYIRSITRPIFGESSHGLLKTCWGCTICADVPFGGLASLGAWRAPPRAEARFKDTCSYLGNGLI